MESKLKIILPAILMLFCIAGILLLNRQSSTLILETQQSISLLKEQESALSSRKNILDSYKNSDSAITNNITLSPVALKYGGQYSSNLSSEIDQFNAAINKISRDGATPESMAKMESAFLSSMLAIENIKAAANSTQASQLRYYGAFSTAAVAILLFSLAYLILYVLFPLQEVVLRDKLRWTKLTSSFQGLKGKIQSMSDDLKHKNQLIADQRNQLKNNQGVLHRLDKEKNQLELSLNQVNQEKTALNTKLSEKEKQYHSLSIDLEKRNSSLKELAQNTHKAETEYQSLKQEVVKIQSILSEKNEKLSALTAEIKSSNEAQEANAELKANVASLDTECDHLRRSLTKKEVQVGEYESKLSSNNEQIDLLNKEVSEFQMQSRVLQQERSFLQNRLESKNMSVDNLTERLEDSKKKMEFVSDQNRDLVDKNQRLETFISDRNTEISEMKAQLRKAEMSAKDLEDENKDLKDRNIQLQSNGNFVTTQSPSNATWIYNIAENHFSYSDAAASILGNTQTQLSNGNNSIAKHLHPESKSSFQSEFNQLKQGAKKSISGKWKIKGKDGKFSWAYLDAYRHTENGSVSIKGVIRYLTGIKETRNHLRDLSFITDQVSDAIMIIDSSNKIEWVNQRYEQLSGYSAKEMVDQPVDNFYKDFINQYNGFSENKAQFNGVVKQHELLKQDKHGNLHWVMMTVSPIYGNDQALERYIVVEKDIDQLKKQQEKLSELSVVAEKTDNFAVVLSGSGELVWNNQQFETEFGKVDNKKDITAYLKTKGVDSGQISRIREAFSSRREYTTEVNAKNGTGSQVYSLNITPQVGAEQDEFLLIGKDITTERNIVENYNRSKDQLDSLMLDQERQASLLRSKEEKLANAMRELESLRGELDTLSILADKTDNAVSIVDAFGNLQWANHKFEALTGYSVEHLKDSFAYHKLRSSRTDTVTFNKIVKSMKSGKAFKYELSFKNKRGEDYMSAMRGIPMLDNEGDVEKYLLIETDLTAIKEAEEKLENLSNIASKVTNAVVSIDLDGNITWANERFARYFNKDIDQLNDLSLDDLFKTSGSSGLLKNILGKEKPSRENEICLDQRGSQKCFSYSFSPIFSSSFEVEKYLVIFTDITENQSLKNELKQAEDRLLELTEDKSQLDRELDELKIKLENGSEITQESFDDKAFDKAPIGISIINAKGYYEYVNKEFCRIYGFSKEDLIEKIFTKVAKRNEVQELKDEHQRFIGGRDISSKEITITTKDGVERTLKVSNSRMTNAENQVKRVNYIMDVTDFKRYETEISELQNQIDEIKGEHGSLEELMQRERELQQALEDSQNLSLVASKTDNAVIITDASGSVEYVNNGFERITGYRNSESVGRRAEALLHGSETTPEQIRTLQQGLSSGRPFNCEMQYSTKNGDMYWASQSVTPILGDQGNIEKYIYIQSDLTQLKEAQKQLQNFTIVANNTINGVLIANSYGEIQWANGQMSQMLGVGGQMLEGKRIEMLFNRVQSTTGDFHGELKRALSSGGHLKSEITLTGMRNDELKLSISLSPNFDETGNTEQFMMICTDLSQQHRLSNASTCGGKGSKPTKRARRL
ncbi:MAG: PAS domain S-box protein [Ekhidna sp.]|nr:PAS domain S-box protein [Ekhidna sp.]